MPNIDISTHITEEITDKNSSGNHHQQGLVLIDAVDCCAVL